MISAVFSQTAGLDVRMSSTWRMPCAPNAGGSAGCSQVSRLGITHETAGKVLFVTSVLNVPGNVGRTPRWYRSLLVFWKFLNDCSIPDSTASETIGTSLFVYTFHGTPASSSASG